ncbi:GlxA family transcriptional regulator [Gallibacterium anatis]|uniref:GlxA family transcriptional regulator n=1 Tax=Gallibacterium anatis TaxID=750 RepID=UPI000530CDA7|nr:helix-turn-helix domain-containing protein [Gallibacterium anatis]KGQ46229.1 AraC family transcriptional regulator [Gallibacterium anatis]KGQ65080.1 AraC family transcriptional regulator [Gallibacterium anatis 7990]
MLAKLPKVVLVLYPDFSPFHFSIPYMVFSLKIDNKPLFELKIVSESRVELSESRFQVFVDGDLQLCQDADLIVLFGWHQQDQKPSFQLQETLKQAYQAGKTIVGLCYGAYPLAYSGLLDGKRATTHWLAEQDFKQRFPAVKLNTQSIYIEDERIMTSAGTAAGLDCCLAIVRHYYGVKIANQVARLLVIPPHREGGQAQFIERPISRKTANENINQIIAMIQQNLTENYTINQLAQRLSMSRSSFTRHFRQTTGMAFNEWLIEMRLQHSKELLESKMLRIEDIALQSGFHSTTAFRQHFKQKYKVSPKQWQKCSQNVITASKKKPL